MAISLEEVEKLREKTGASYEACKDALERSGGDMLDAVIFLEQQGKCTKKGTTAYTYTTRSTGTTAEDVRRVFSQSDAGKGKKGTEPENDWRDWLREIGEMGLNLLRHSTVNQLEVWRNGRLMTSVPVLILALLIVLAFWITIPLLIVGLFIGCRYRFVGPDLGKEKINDVMDNVSATVDDMVGHMKREFVDGKETGEEAAKRVEKQTAQTVKRATEKAEQAAKRAEEKVAHALDNMYGHIDDACREIDDAFSDKH